LDKNPLIYTPPLSSQPLNLHHNKLTKSSHKKTKNTANDSINEQKLHTRLGCIVKQFATCTSPKESFRNGNCTMMGKRRLGHIPSLPTASTYKESSCQGIDKLIFLQVRHLILVYIQKGSHTPLHRSLLYRRTNR
jgi:hypothetical protein